MTLSDGLNRAYTPKGHTVKLLRNLVQTRFRRSKGAATDYSFASPEGFAICRSGTLGSMPRPSREVEIFTDGSCDTLTGRGGWGYLLRYGDRQKTASGFQADTTNNRMELTAAVEALSALKEPCRVRLMTDSQYLKNAFTAGWLRNWQRNGWKTAGKQPVKNRDLWERLLALEKLHDLHWSWTKGHAGHAENELVDRLALDARRRGGAPSG